MKLHATIHKLYMSIVFTMISFIFTFCYNLHIHKTSKFSCLNCFLQFSSTEVMSIRSARCYDLESQAIILGNGQPCTLENMKAASLGHYSELLYEFCHNMASFKTDNAEYALVTAICIFSG